MQESEASEPVDLGDYEIADLDTELQAEVEFDDIFDHMVPHSHEGDVTSSGPTTSSSNRDYPSLLSKGRAKRAEDQAEDRTNSFNAQPGLAPMHRASRKYPSLLTLGKRSRDAKSNKPLII
jgi:hypothetical protein